jgi:AcrR family transcriptional regulator
VARVELDDRVLDAVERVLTRSGIAGLTVSAVAEEANVSRVTLHRRGATVDDLLVAVIVRVIDDWRGSLWPVLTGPGDAASRLRTAFETLCAVCERNAGVMAAMYGVPARPLPGRPGRTTSLEGIEPFERLLRDGVVDGSLRSADPRRDATLAVNAAIWAYLHMRRAHRWPREEVSARVVALVTADFVATAPAPTSTLGSTAQS